MSGERPKLAKEQRIYRRRGRNQLPPGFVQLQTFLQELQMEDDRLLQKLNSLLSASVVDSVVARHCRPASKPSLPIIRWKRLQGRRSPRSLICIL
jgi:hypothetical protein